MSTRTVIAEHDHCKGLATAPITLIEYGDFQCPYSGKAYGILQELEACFTSELRIIYRHFPMTELHTYAMIAAETAEAAGAQGRFWQMHDLLYRNQPRFDADSLLAYAMELDLDVDQIAHDLETTRHGQRIRADFLSGLRGGVDAAPTLFINGQRYDGALETAELTRVLEAICQRSAHVAS